MGISERGMRREKRSWADPKMHSGEESMGRRDVDGEEGGEKRRGREGRGGE